MNVLVHCIQGISRSVTIVIAYLIFKLGYDYKKAEQLVKHSDAYYLDEEELVWRYNLKGALKFYFISQWVRPLKRGLRSLGLVKG